MDLQFDEMTVDTMLAQEYIQKNEALSELYEDYDELTEKSGFFFHYYFDGKLFHKNVNRIPDDIQRPNEYSTKLWDLASRLKQNATLIAQLEYYTRNIPAEDTNTQLKLVIQYLKCDHPTDEFNEREHQDFFFEDSLLFLFGSAVGKIMDSSGRVILFNGSKETAAILHLFVTLCKEAGLDCVFVVFCRNAPERHQTEPKGEVKGLDSGTVAIVSEDADVDSAVDKFLSASKKAPWRLRRILVQESVYQQFKDALSWKCSLKQHGGEPPASDVLCSDALTYNGRVFLIDPVGLPKDQQSVTVEAYRTRKEMISLVQKDKPRYLSLWANDIAEINEVTHCTISPVVWVNNLGDFRGPPQITEAVFSYLFDTEILIKKCDKVSKLCELSQSWMKLDFESRRDILYSVLEKCMTSDSNNRQVYTKIKKSLAACTMKSFVDVGKDYVCVGMSKAVGVKGLFFRTPFNVETFKSMLYGNAFVIFGLPSTPQSNVKYAELDVLEQAGIPVIDVGEYVAGDFIISRRIRPDGRLRVVWTNSGTIFAN